MTIVTALLAGTALLAACVQAAPQVADRSDRSSAGAECGESTVRVTSSAQLAEALDAVRPGESIELAPGTYTGRFVATVEGTADSPITLCGPAEAILDGADIEKGYVLHLDGVAHWTVAGFTIRGGQKGLMADGVTHSVIRDLTVDDIGDEGIHLRRFSTDNLVTGNTVSGTGQRKPKFGEGIYIGTAESNWCDVTECEPDRSDRNEITDNTITGTTAEAIDIKEGTSAGVVKGNRFDGAEMVGADSWVDVKGNDWLIVGNSGAHSSEDGFQTHEILEGWGTRNTFRANVAAVSGAGFGYSLTPELENVVECDNTASDAGKGLTNVDCVTP